jgi:hypothetical protein
MKFGLGAGMLGIVALSTAVAGCTGSGGGGILDRPGGTIYLTDANTGRSVDGTSLTNPYLVSDLRFTIDATETHFDGPYTVAVIAETNVPTQSNGGFPYGYSYNVPCFTPTQNGMLTTAAVPITFSGNAANGNPGSYITSGLPTPNPMTSMVPTSAQAGNPCHSGELETATISDTDGHTVNFYYEEYP